MPPKPKVFKGVKENAIKPNKEQNKARTPVYTPEEARKRQRQINKPKTKSSMGYSGATKA
jgi:hypothetical protein